MRFYGEYMGMGVALKPLGGALVHRPFPGCVDAFDNGNSGALQKPIEGYPILPWKNRDASWRHK